MEAIVFRVKKAEVEVTAGKSYLIASHAGNRTRAAAVRAPNPNH